MTADNLLSFFFSFSYNNFEAVSAVLRVICGSAPFISLFGCQEFSVVKVGLPMAIGVLQN